MRSDKISSPHSTKTIWHWFPPVLVALLLLVALCALVEPTTLTPSALKSTLPFVSFLAIAAVGQALVVGQAGFDFSVAGLMTASAVLVAQASGSENSGLVTGLVISLAVAVAGGVVNGLVITRLHITPLVATLATNAVLLGVVLNVSDSVPVAVPPALSTFALSNSLGVPNTFWIAIVFVAAAALIMTKTKYGRRLILTGTNPKAANASGIRVSFYIVGAYTAAALCYWVAGVLLAGYVGNPNRDTGNPYILLTITAVVLGGAALSGGRVNLIHVAIGSLFLIQLTRLITSLGASSGVQYIVQAIVVASAVLATTLSGRVNSIRTRVLSTKDQRRATASTA